jgi:hypothetical protein
VRIHSLGPRDSQRLRDYLNNLAVPTKTSDLALRSCGRGRHLSAKRTMQRISVTIFVAAHGGALKRRSTTRVGRVSVPVATSIGELIRKKSLGDSPGLENSSRLRSPLFASARILPTPPIRAVSVARRIRTRRVAVLAWQAPIDRRSEFQNLRARARALAKVSGGGQWPFSTPYPLRRPCRGCRFIARSGLLTSQHGDPTRSSLRMQPRRSHSVGDVGFL